MTQSNSNFTPGSGTAPAPSLSIYGPRPFVTRISRRAVLVAALIGAAVALMILVVGLGDARQPRRDVQPDENAVRSSGPNESVKDLPSDYSFDVRQAARGIGYEAILNPPAPAPATRPLASPALPVSLPHDDAMSDPLRQLNELRRRLLEEQRKAAEQALDSPLVFAGAKSPRFNELLSPTTSPSRPSDADSAMGTTIPNRPDQRRIAEGGAAGTASTNDVGLVALPNRPSDKEAFLMTASAVEPYLTKPLVVPRSRHELKAGSVIPAALLTAVNTDLPGEVLAQVTENVYDSATGDDLLVPQGSRLLGKYQSLVTNGQNRALLVWQRLIYPNGNSIILDGMPGTDASGRAGLADEVDYHLGKLTVATALTTALAYAGNLARNPHASSGVNGGSGQDTIGDTVAQQTNRIGEKVIDKELDVQPTIKIRSGWPLRVLVNKDLILAPYAP